MVELKLASVSLDKTSRISVLVLEEEESEAKRIILIYIAEPEAHAIDIALKNLRMPRPMTHDLMLNIVERLTGTVTAIHINDYHGKTFYATLKLKSDSGEYDIDSRPSDAIALALRCDVPIYIEEALIEQHGLFASELNENKNMVLDLDVEPL
ncbi:bifunctional nuclease family protein [Candidatus Poribacteria bacterium]|nr:bifunctional nuclease family protein [Candidatus Poribacteria bacterium]